MEFINKHLNNLSQFEDISKAGVCPKCKSDLYIKNNYMEQRLGGVDICFCSNNEDHLFERDRRTGQIAEYIKRHQKR